MCECSIDVDTLSLRMVIQGFELQVYVASIRLRWNLIDQRRNILILVSYRTMENETTKTFCSSV